MSIVTTVAFSDNDPSASVGFKTAAFHRQAIRTGDQKWQYVIATPVGGGGEMNTGIGVDAFNFGSDDYRPGRIGDASQEGASSFLALQR